MPRRKKTFICGHKGYGQNCHRCKQQQTDIERQRKQKLDWEATFAEDAIDLKNLPKNVVLKSRRIINHLQSQGDYHQFHGKRLRHDRFIISIPVTRSYRLICRDCGTLLIPEAVVSHEDYNVVKPGR